MPITVLEKPKIRAKAKEAFAEVERLEKEIEEKECIQNCSGVLALFRLVPKFIQFFQRKILRLAAC